MSDSLSLPVFVPLEDWYEELGDEQLDPLNILITDEDDDHIDVNASLTQTFGVKEMSTTQAKPKSFDVKSWLATAKVITGGVEKPVAKVYPCPSWLELSSGTINEGNAFAVCAGVVKSARLVIDALTYTSRQYDEAVENLAQQESRATREFNKPMAFGPEITKVGITLTERQSDRSEAAGFNPDGVEFQEAIHLAEAEVEKLEAVLANGERIMSDILNWIEDNAADLGLKVETGYTVKKGIIGNEIRTRKYETLDVNNLVLAIDKQKEFIRQGRMTRLNVGVQQNNVNEIQ